MVCSARRGSKICIDEGPFLSSGDVLRRPWTPPGQRDGPVRGRAQLGFSMAFPVANGCCEYDLLDDRIIFNGGKRKLTADRKLKKQARKPHK